MINVIEKKKTVGVRVLAILVTLAAAVLLPQVCHLFGRAAGVGSALGEMLLPMHLPILLAGMLAGPLVGGVAGVLAPLVSFALTGMPGVALLPFMVIELGVYGLCSGTLAKLRMPVIVQLLIAQLAGRAVRALAILLAVYAFSYTAIPVAIIWNSVRVGLLGIALQWLVVPLVAYRVRDAR